MELGTFTPREHSEGDRLQAKEAVDKPLIVLVREHRTGIKTQYKPDGGEGVIVDVADTIADEIYLDVLWMNGAVVDNLAPFVGQPVPIKLVWTPSAKGGNPYISVAPLDGDQLAQAQRWAAGNANRFDIERVSRAAGNAQVTAPAATPAAIQPTTTPPPVTPAVIQPAASVDVNDPAVQALLAQIAGGQVPKA